MCSAELIIVDVDTGETFTLDMTIAETNITFNTQQLRENRRYNVTIISSNAAGSATLQTRISRLYPVFGISYKMYKQY